MAEQLRHGLVANTLAVQLEGEVEVDEACVVAGHKGQPAEVAKGGGRADAAGWRARRAELRKVPSAKPMEDAAEGAARWRGTSRRSWA